MATRVSGAALPEDDEELPELVEDGDPLLPEPEALVPEAVAPEPNVSPKVLSWLRDGGILPAPVAEAVAAPVPAGTPEVAVKKYELMQLDWHEAYACVSSWVPLPCGH